MKAGPLIYTYAVFPLRIKIHYTVWVLTSIKRLFAYVLYLENFADLLLIYRLETQY